MSDNNNHWLNDRNSEKYREVYNRVFRNSGFGIAAEPAAEEEAGGERAEQARTVRMTTATSFGNAVPNQARETYELRYKRLFGVTPPANNSSEESDNE